MKVIANQENEYIIDILRAALPMLTFSHAGFSIDDIMKENTVISEDSISYSKDTGIIINRNTKKILVLTSTNNLNSENITKIREILGNIFHVYIEPADDIDKYIKSEKIDSFEFRNYMENLFKNYHDTDYLLLSLK